MNGKKTLIAAALALLVLLIGAYLLYGRLSAEETPEQLAVAETEPPAVQKADAPPEESTSALVDAPDFTVFDLEGNAVKLSDFFGKPIVVNFWASWCGPCQTELPDFQSKYNALGDSVQFLLVNMTDGVQETVDTASAFIARKGYTIPVYYDTQVSAARAYGVNALPCTYFIDAQGHAIAQATGAIDAKTLQRGIDMITDSGS